MCFKKDTVKSTSTSICSIRPLATNLPAYSKYLRWEGITYERGLGLKVTSF